MFGKRDSSEAVTQENSNQMPVRANTSTEHTPPVRAVPASPIPVSARRAVDVPHGNSRRTDRSEHGERKLIVGRGLSLSGEIAACDILVVEGKVEAKLTDGKMLEIAESGQFRGSVEIESADIAGRYDGEITVHGRLTVRSTGRVSGIVRYGELEVNAGGQIIGELQVFGENAASANKGTFRSAARFTALGEEEEIEAEPQQPQQRRA